MKKTLNLMMNLIGVLAMTSCQDTTDFYQVDVEPSYMHCQGCEASDVCAVEFTLDDWTNSPPIHIKVNGNNVGYVSHVLPLEVEVSVGDSITFGASNYTPHDEDDLNECHKVLTIKNVQDDYTLTTKYIPPGESMHVFEVTKCNNYVPALESKVFTDSNGSE